MVLAMLCCPVCLCIASFKLYTKWKPTLLSFVHMPPSVLAAEKQLCALETAISTDGDEHHSLLWPSVEPRKLGGLHLLLLVA